MRTALFLAAVTVASAATAQIPIPAFGSTFTSTLTRGFWFQAPSGFVIQGLRVPNEGAQPFQVVEVIDLGPAAPPAYPGTVTGTQLFYNNSTASGNIIPCNIAITPGQYIGILGACTATVGNGTSYNSYAAVAGPFASTIMGNPVTLTRFGTQSGIASNGGNQPCWQEVAGQISRVEVFVGTGSGNFASASTYGTGCYLARNASFYQLFQPNTFNLSNSTIMMLPGSNSYAVVAGASPPNWWTPVSANLGLTDDSVSGAQTLGFTFPYPGGSTSSVYVSSNGYVWLQASTDNGCCAGDPATLLSSLPRICPQWGDLNPGAGGTVIFDQDLPNGAAYVTYTNVPEYATSNLNTFQVAFFSSGVVEMRFQSCTNVSHTLLTGFSPGGNSTDPGSVNLTTAMPFTTGTQLTPLSLIASARPIVNTSINLVTANFPANSGLGANILSFTQHNPGIDLTSIGMPGCSQFVGLDTSVVMIPSAGSATRALAIPNNPGLSGLHVYSQSAAFSAGVNALGVLASNGMNLTIGLQ